MTVIVVAGVPGSGKTTLAHALGAALGVSVISKDVIKESLMDTLGTGDLDWVNKLSEASHQIMYRMATSLTGDLILEAHFHAGTAERALLGLERPLFQVYCRCPLDVAWQRYQARRDDPSRHPGHLPEHQDELATAGWRNAEPHPLELDAPLLEVDTTCSVDIEELAAQFQLLTNM